MSKKNKLIKKIKRNSFAETIYIYRDSYDKSLKVVPYSQLTDHANAAIGVYKLDGVKKVKIVVE